MAKFGSFKFGEAKFGTDDPEPGGGSGSSSSSPSRAPWKFFDASTGDVYEWVINPSEASIPGHEKTFVAQPTASGAPVIYEGYVKAPSFTFSGTILTEGHYRVLEAWASKEKQVRITDDLGRHFWVYITNFSPTRRRNTQYPWRMDYTAAAVILDWGTT